MKLLLTLAMLFLSFSVDGKPAAQNPLTTTIPTNDEPDPGKMIIAGFGIMAYMARRKFYIH